MIRGDIVKHIPASVLLLLACAVMLASSEVNAQARGPSVTEIQERLAEDPATARAAELAALDAWLRRLVGRFRIPDMTAFGGMPVAVGKEGTGDCASIGSGSGVQCMFSFGRIGGYTRGLDTVYVFGVDPDELGIRYMGVNFVNTAESALGKLEGDSVTFKIRCFLPRNPEDRAEQVDCNLRMRIYAPPDSKDVRIDYTYVQRMRVPPNPSGGGSRMKGFPSTVVADMKRLPEDQSGETPQVKSAR